MKITSGRERQAILVVDGLPLDVDHPPDNLRLFDDQGNPIDFSGSHGVPPGGSTGQVLVKKTNSDFDTHWVAGGTGGGGESGYLGPWDADTAYPEGSIVDYDPGQWIATDDIPAGVTPVDGSAWATYNPPTIVDENALHWRGEYASGTQYHQNDLVVNGGKIWLAPGDLLGVTPAPVASALIGTVRGVQAFTTDKVATLRSYTIDANSDTNDIAGRKSKVIVIDKNDGSDISVTVKNNGSATLALPKFTGPGGSFVGNLVSDLAPGASATGTISNTFDIYVVAYFASVDAGSFEVSVDPPDKVVPPPTADWFQFATI